MVALSPSQEKIRDEIAEWTACLPRTWVHCHGASDCPKWPHTHGDGSMAPVKALGGAAGTGKTTLLKALDPEIEGDSVFGTPTHKAASVLRKKLPPKMAERVRTYHSMVYQMMPDYRCSITRRIVTSKGNHCVCGKPDVCECPMQFLHCGVGAPHVCHVTAELKQERRQHLGGHRDFIIIDEASMLSKAQVDDIRKFGVPILLVGDRRQLPPIKEAMNPWTLNPDWELTEVHRQGAGSGILEAAHEVSATGAMSKPSYGSTGDTVRMSHLAPDFEALLKRFNPSVDGAIITYTNATRAAFNSYYHEQLVGGGLVDVGDRVVALGGQPYEAARVVMENGVPTATGQFIMVHNSMMGTVLKVSHRGVVSELTVQLDDHPAATADDPMIILTGAVPTAQFGADKELSFTDPRRPKGTHMWDYGYALTAHKAQGSEFPRVIVIDERPRDYNKWMYTAITRAQEACVVVDWRG